MQPLAGNSLSKLNILLHQKSLVKEGQAIIYPRKAQFLHLQILKGIPHVLYLKYLHHLINFFPFFSH